MTINLRSVLDEAAENELGPTARLSEKNLVIDGIVVQTGMKNQKTLKVSAHNEFFSRDVKGEAESVLTQVPFAVIEPGDGKPGRCMCFFKTHNIGKLATFKPKSKIRVLAQLQRFVKQTPHEVLAADCDFPG